MSQNVSGKYSREQVVQVISSVMGSVQPVSQPEYIHAELSRLAETIDSMHADILATRSYDVADKHIPTATDELDAIVGATAKASASIMDACENIQSIVETADQEVQDAIMAETTNIFEACSFQDITGQRITKVITTLSAIEETVNNLIGLFGHAKDTEKAEEIDERTEDERLLNGPQMDNQAISQEEIDRLLAEFD